ncbi:hypothetical protein [Schlesneria sp.]|uniref:hypothetical protein n=1 Tax=Schlesneria sp. TaxID=2762018 RepID=UPI002F221B83
MKSNGLATILILIPVLTVPALAIFGIPQFAPVVASPLEDDSEIDREMRLSRSSRSQREGAPDEMDRLDSQPRLISQSSTSLRRGSSNRDSKGLASRETGNRRNTESAAAGWGDDLEADSNWPETPRRSASAEPDDSDAAERAAMERNFQAMAEGGGFPSRYERKSRREENPSGKTRPVDSEEQDDGIKQVAYEQAEPQEPQPRRPKSPNTPRPSDPRGQSRRETAPASLTWAAAVEQLNEFDIRNFRLEPGDRSGQFVFICTYASPEEPTVSYRFEAGADEPLKAVEKVLEQIVAWRQKQ